MQCVSLVNIYFLQQTGDAHAIFHDFAQIVDVNALLLHRVTIAQGHFMVVGRIVVNGHAEWRSHCILATIALTNRVFRIAIMRVEMKFEVVNNLLCQLGQPILLV